MRQPHPKNAPGPFYVVDGCCTLCGVPDSAPALFEVDYQQARHCWVRQQPRTDAQLTQMLDVIAMADLQCIRYRGDDLDLIERLRAMNEADVVDASAELDDP